MSSAEILSGKITQACQMFRFGFGVTFSKPNSKEAQFTNWTQAKNEGEITRYLTEHPDSNAMLLTSGFVVIDSDMGHYDGQDGIGELRNWELDNGELPETWTVITGNGGYQQYYKQRPGEHLRNRTGGKGGMISDNDIRADGGLVLAPGSVHPDTGRVYEFEAGFSPDDIPMATVNDTVSKLALWGKSENSDNEPFEAPDKIPKGQRHDTFLSMACSMRAKNYTYKATLAAVMAENEERASEPWDVDAITALVNDVWSRYPAGTSTQNAENDAQDTQAVTTQGVMHAQLYANADPRPALSEPVRTLAEILPLVNRNRPEVIEGLLFDGGEMILQAPPKTGKSTAELWLAACMASGHDWFGHRVRKCATLYINTEGELDDYGNALADLMEQLEGIDPDLIHVWDISGKTTPLDLIENALNERAKAIEGLGLILLDSVFPIITGDENSNTDMSYFTNILQRIRLETGVALVFCHHTSKGAGQYSETMYRSSGAGVWARHPTTILDVARVKVKPAIRAARLNIEQCRVIDSYLDSIGSPFTFSDDTRKVADDYRRACVDVLEPERMNELIAILDATEKRVKGSKAVRVSVTRRGAQEPPPSAHWYDYPLFVADRDGLLARASDDDGTSKPTQTELAEKRHSVIIAAIDEAVTQCHVDGYPPTRANVLERIEDIDGKRVSRDQLRSWTQNSADWSPWRVASDGTNELRRIEADTQT